MRASIPEGQFLVEDETDVYRSGSGEESLSRTYRVEPQPPASVITPHYYLIGGHGVQEGACAPSDGPYGDIGCRSEAQVINYAYQRMLADFPQCSFTPYTVLGQNVYPFAYASYNGHLSHYATAAADQRRIEYTVNCGAGDILHDQWRISSWTQYTCPPGLLRSAGGYGSGQAPPGYTPIDYNRLCSSPARPVIYSTLLQFHCENGNCNPTFPGTGDKARFEPDFEFAGRPFSRSYHSLLQTDPKHALAPGWSHSFSDRLVLLAARNYRFDERGYYEAFDWIATDTFRSVANPNRILRKLSDRYRLVDDGEDVREYDLSGTLLRIYAPGNPLDALELTYASGSNRLLSVADGAGRELLFDYQGDRLTTVSLPDGTEIAYEYGNAGDLVRVVYPGGASRRYVYDEAGLAPAGSRSLLTGIIDENGDRHASFGYDSRGRVVLSTLHTGDPGHPTHDATSIAYTGDDQATVTRATGEQVAYAFRPGWNRRTTAKVGGDGSTQATYDAYGRRTSFTDKTGVVTEYTYSDSALTGTTEAAGTAAERRTLVERDAWQKPLSIETQSKVGGAFVTVGLRRFARDASGAVIAVCDVDPASPNLGYACGSAVDAPAGVRQTRVLRCTAADAAAPGSPCPLVGAMKAVDGPLPGQGDLASYQYYPSTDESGCGTGGACHRRGQLWKAINALGHVTELRRYDRSGRPLQVRDANGVDTDLQYTARGWLASRKVRGTDPGSELDDAISTMDYDNLGQVIRATSPGGDWLAFDHDAAHRLVRVEDAAGNTVNLSLDGAGNVLQQTLRDAGGTTRHTQGSEYNALGQLARQLSATLAPTDYTYEANGRLATAVDGLGRTSTRAYDPLGRVVQSIANETGAGNERAVTGLQYDGRDNLVAVVDPKGLTTAYTYDGLDNLVQLQSPDTGSSYFAYDAAGRAIERRDARGVTISYQHDALGRLIRAMVPTPGRDLVFTYDLAGPACQAGETHANGRLARAASADASTDYCYDRRGNVVRKVQAATGGPTQVVAYAHDSADRLVGLTLPSGATLTYQRNALGQVTGVQVKRTGNAAVETLVSDIRYLPYGPMESITFGNGRVQSRLYDANYDISYIEDGEPGGFAMAFALDPAGQIGLVEEQLAYSGYASRTIDYDGLGRLTALSRIVLPGPKSGSGLVEGFSYDATGNRLTRSAGTATTHYTYPTDSHRLTRVGTQNRVYDASGNSTTLHTKQFTYDDYGRMREYRSGTTLRNEYRYNARGERIGKIYVTSPGSTRYFVYDEAGHLLGEYQSSGVAVKEYVWVDDRLVAVLGSYQGHTFQYALTDHLGTPRAVVDPPTNTIIWRWHLTDSAFGDHAPLDNPDGDGANYALNLRYPGQYYDGETGLHYNYFRDYDPSTGRYLQSDPIGLRGGISTYAYGGGNPISLIDPLGLEWRYNSATGRLSHNGAYVATGYAGRGAGYNNPWIQNVPNTGPLPTGRYTIGPQYNSPNTGRATMALTPASDNEMYGRSAFRIHGDNSRRNGTASEGCMIFDRNIRDQIANSGDNDLVVENPMPVIIPFW